MTQPILDQAKGARFGTIFFFFFKSIGYKYDSSIENFRIILVLALPDC